MEGERERKDKKRGKGLKGNERRKKMEVEGGKEGGEECLKRLWECFNEHVEVSAETGGPL